MDKAKKYARRAGLPALKPKLLEPGIRATIEAAYRAGYRAGYKAGRNSKRSTYVEWQWKLK